MHKKLLYTRSSLPFVPHSIIHAVSDVVRITRMQLTHHTLFTGKLRKTDSNINNTNSKLINNPNHNHNPTTLQLAYHCICTDDKFTMRKADQYSNNHPYEWHLNYLEVTRWFSDHQHTNSWSVTSQTRQLADWTICGLVNSQTANFYISHAEQLSNPNFPSNMLANWQVKLVKKSTRHRWKVESLVVGLRLWLVLG